MRNQRQRECKLCGAPFVRKRRSVGGETRQIYCSPECMQKRYRQTPKGRASHREAQARYCYTKLRPVPILALAFDLIARNDPDAGGFCRVFRGLKEGPE